MIIKHGDGDASLILLHGGPGATGSLSGMAGALSSAYPLLEQIQTEHSIAGLADELDADITADGNAPYTLVGHSWGCWLALIYAADHPEKVKQLILIGCGPLHDSYVPMINARRLARLEAPERERLSAILTLLAAGKIDATTMENASALIASSDDYDADPALHTTSFDHDAYAAIWPEAQKLRSSGELTAYAARVSAPIALIHGKEDPHPIEGVTEMLSAAKIPFDLYLLEHCGHSPFDERHAREAFYDLLSEIMK